MRYFEMHGLKPDWSAFLDDFQRDWPTDGEAEWLGKQALDECEARFGRNRSACAWALNNLAIVYKSEGKYADAERLYQRALAILRKARGANHPDVATLLSNLAFVYDLQGRYADAERLSRTTPSSPYAPGDRL